MLLNFPAWDMLHRIQEEEISLEDGGEREEREGKHGRENEFNGRYLA